jgi:hypothetical protein
MLMFALLEHDVGAAVDAQPGAGARVHWDFLLELPGREKLATWRLAANPIEHEDAIAAERIGEHRRAYLDYEGELSGGRGSVKRIDRGPVLRLSEGGDRIVSELLGERLRGVFEIVHESGAAAGVFRRATAIR